MQSLGVRTETFLTGTLLDQPGGRNQDLRSGSASAVAWRISFSCCCTRCNRCSTWNIWTQVQHLM